MCTVKYKKMSSESPAPVRIGYRTVPLYPTHESLRPSLDQTHPHVRYYTYQEESCAQLREVFGDRIECKLVPKRVMSGVRTLRRYLETRPRRVDKLPEFYWRVSTPQTEFYEGIQKEELDELVSWAEGLPEPASPEEPRAKIIIPWQVLACAYLPIPGSYETVSYTFNPDSRYYKDVSAPVPTEALPRQYESRITYFSPTGFDFSAGWNDRGGRESRDAWSNALRAANSSLYPHELDNDGKSAIRNQGFERTYTFNFDAYLNASFGSVERKTEILNTLNRLADMGVEVVIERTVEDTKSAPSRDGVLTPEWSLERTFENMSPFTRSRFSSEVYREITSRLMKANGYTIFRQMTCDYSGCESHTGQTVYNWGVYKRSKMYTGSTAFGRRRRDAHGRFL